MNKTKEQLKGQLIGVSLGPGNPDLITRGAWKELQRENTVWVYPARSGKTPSYALEIAKRAGLEMPQTHMQLLFPMTHDEEKLKIAWAKAAQTILPHLNAGQDVLFLVEGDASTYATFGHLARTIKSIENQINTKIIAGVNSFIAAAADINTPIAEQDDTVAIIPAAYGVAALDKMLPDFDTLILMKIKPLIDEIINWLNERGLIQHAHFIERVGAVDEKILKREEINQLKGQKINYLSLLIIKNPNRVRGERIKGCLKK